MPVKTTAQKVQVEVIYIYALCDRRGCIRYIGQAENMHKRLIGHWATRDKPGRKNAWLRRMTSPPEMRLLFVVEESQAAYFESMAIAAARAKWGGYLLNATSRERHSPAWREVVRSAAFSATMSDAGRRRWDNPEHIIRQQAAMPMSDRARMMRHTSATKARIGAAARARHADPELRERMHAGLKQNQ